MGGIDVDPATNDDARASTLYTIETDCLAHDWIGRTLLNPPYSYPAPFVAKLLVELDAGRTTDVLVLVNARTRSGWFQSLAVRAWRYDIRERIEFWRPDRPDGSAGRTSSVAFYVGPNVRRFARVAFHARSSTTT